MNERILLKTFNHTIFPSSLKYKAQPVTHGEQPLLTAVINFEQGIFSLEGNWHYIMSCNKHAAQDWFKYHQQRVSIQAGIFPGYSIDLRDDCNDGAVFVIDGTITDINDTSSCSGLMVLDKIGSDNTGTNWNVSVYLYNENKDDSEIAIKIPVPVYRTSSRLN